MDYQFSDEELQKQQEQAKLFQQNQQQMAGGPGVPAPPVPTAAFILQRIEERRDELLKELATIELAAENLRKIPELAQLYDAIVQIQMRFGIR